MCQGISSFSTNTTAPVERQMRAEVLGQRGERQDAVEKYGEETYEKNDDHLGQIAKDEPGDEQGRKGNPHSVISGSLNRRAAIATLDRTARAGDDHGATTELTLRLRPELLASLDELAGATRRSRLELAEEALAQYLEVQRWQVDGIRAAIEEADRGEPGIQHERVAAWIDSWGTDDELPPPER